MRCFVFCLHHFLESKPGLGRAALKFCPGTLVSWFVFEELCYFLCVILYHWSHHELPWGPGFLFPFPAPLLNYSLGSVGMEVGDKD